MKGQFHVRPRRISSLNLPLSFVYQTYMILILFALKCSRMHTMLYLDSFTNRRLSSYKHQLSVAKSDVGTYTWVIQGSEPLHHLTLSVDQKLERKDEKQKNEIQWTWQLWTKKYFLFYFKNKTHLQVDQPIPWNMVYCFMITLNTQ